MKDFKLSYDKELSCNNIFISSDIEMIILYTHFMKNLKNTWNYEVHTHSFNELHIILDGKCKMNLGNRDIELSKYEYILVPANTKHCFINCSNDFFRFSMAFDILYEKSQALTPSSSVLRLNQRCTAYIKAILNEYKENKIGCRNIISSMLHCLIIEVLRQSDVFGSTKYVSGVSSHFFKALQFVDNNISHKITTADVADEVFLSVRHLNRIFYSNLNMTVSQYIKARKIDNSKKFLKETELNVKEVALLTGFDDEASFCKFFKREIGISPAKYRLSQKK